jgi:hypothetical protein
MRALPLFRVGLMLAALAVSGGCSKLDWFSSDKKEAPVNPNVFPSDFKAQILRTVPTLLDDPTGIREAYYSDPIVEPNSPITVYSSCVRFNARDSSKEYVGVRDYIAYYYGGQLDQFFQAKDNQCARAAYKPFTELERLAPRNKLAS